MILIFCLKAFNFNKLLNPNPSRMKKLLCIMVLVLSTCSAFAQLYLRGNVGYNLPANSQVIGTNSSQVYNSDLGQYETTQEAVYGSFGSGLSFNLGLGATINGTIGYDVELGYLLGKEYTTNQKYTDDFYKTKQTSRSFQIAPSITFTAGTGNIQPYTRIGPVIGFTKLKFEETEHSSSYPYSDYDESTETEFSGGMSLGFKGVLGVAFHASEKIQFFGEVNFLSMSYAPKDGQITAYTVDGEDALDSLPKEEKSFELKDEITNDDAPYTRLRDKYSMGSCGVQIGVKYVLK